MPSVYLWFFCLFAIQTAAWPHSSLSPNLEQASDSHENGPKILPRYIKDNDVENVKQSDEILNRCNENLKEVARINGRADTKPYAGSRRDTSPDQPFDNSWLSMEDGGILDKRQNWRSSDSVLLTCRK